MITSAISRLHHPRHLAVACPGDRTKHSATIGGAADFVNNYQYAFDSTNNLFGQMSQVTQTSNGGSSVGSR